MSIGWWRIDPIDSPTSSTGTEQQPPLLYRHETRPAPAKPFGQTMMEERMILVNAGHFAGIPASSVDSIVRHGRYKNTLQIEACRIRAPQQVSRQDGLLPL